MESFLGSLILQKVYHNKVVPDLLSLKTTLSLDKINVGSVVVRNVQTCGEFL